ncbi:MAG: hypothetical protein R3E32_05180 [Chitinophagales bacterium]
MSKKIAFATCRNLPHPAEDDKLLADYLRHAGFEVLYAVWNDAKIVWQDFDMVLIRSTWDYHKHIEAWREWLQLLEEKRVNVLNPVKTIRWNMHKSYLKEMEANGVQIVPTFFAKRGSKFSLKEILEKNGWWKAVVKPAVSLDAFHTWLTDLPTAEKQQNNFEALVMERDVMVQPFMPEINTRGEYSFVFFGGKFSHVVLKSNPTGDFRIQGNYGGRNQLIEVSPALISQATHILQSIDLPHYYARIDAIEREEQLYLMELELIEPSLFLDLEEEAVRRLGELVKVQINTTPSPSH